VTEGEKVVDLSEGSGSAVRSSRSRSPRRAPLRRYSGSARLRCFNRAFTGREYETGKKINEGQNE
jgi:hypothetical protein